jgi:hypothetical protein
MEAAEMAYLARLRGEHQKARQLFQEALRKESQAASFVSEAPSSEPSRSLLYRSAASLAVDCGEFQEAQRLITEGLSRNTPLKIAQEFRALSKQIRTELSAV